MDSKLHILLCEDEESLGMLVREYLQAKGYNAELFLDGEAGFKAFTRGKYDMCLLDVMMPKMDGFTLAKEIRMLNADIPIIFLTAKNLKDDILEGIPYGGHSASCKRQGSEQGDALHHGQVYLRHTTPAPDYRQQADQADHQGE